MPVRGVIAAAGLVLLAPAAVDAQVLEFEGKGQWMAAAATFSTADFTGFPSGTFITEQYHDALGVVFTDGADVVICCGGPSYPEDGAGLNGAGDIDVAFDTPQHGIAIDYPGISQFELYSGGKSIYLSSPFVTCPDVGCFAGLVSYQPFDSARISGIDGPAHIDNLHFGPGNGCPWDLDDTAQVGITDFLALLALWGTDPAGPPDFDGDAPSASPTSWTFWPTGAPASTSPTATATAFPTSATYRPTTPARMRRRSLTAGRP